MVCKFKILLFKIFFGKEAEVMIEFFAYMVIDKRVDIEKVPGGIREAVRELVKDLGAGYLVGE